MDFSHLCGWVQNEAEVDRIVSSLPTPFFQSPATEDRDTTNSLIFKQMVGQDAPNGPQKIGDCVSWGWGNATNYTTVLEMWLQLQETKAATGMDPEQYAAAVEEARYQYEEACTEAIYALSRVEIGGKRGSQRDGSVGAWAAKAVTQFGAISRPQLDRMGLSGTYDGNRAKSWGASGLPDNLEPEAKNHPFAEVTPVRTFNDLKFHTQNYRVVPVCSNVGFQNGSGGAITTRDDKGFARPRGTWGHCFPPGTLIAGPVYKEVQHLEVGDTVYDHEGKKQKVTATLHKPGSGTLVRTAVAGGLPLVSTPDHKHYVLRDGEFQWIEARKIVPGDKLATPRIKMDSSIHDDVAWFMGFFVGDGHSRHNGIEITLGKKKPLEKLLKGIRAYGYEPVVRDFGTYWRVNVYSVDLGKQFKEYFGEYSHGKKLPGWLLTNHAAIDGLFAADACTDRGRHILTTVSPILAEQVRLALSGAGLRPNTYTKEVFGGRLQYVVWHMGNRGRNSTADYSLYTVKSVTEFDNSDDVYCVEVENSHSMVAGGYATHNCMLFVDTCGGSRPGALILNQWGDNVVSGPMGVREIPKCSWWVDADVVEKMLAQNDSFCPTKYKGYPARKLSWRF